MFQDSFFHRIHSRVLRIQHIACFFQIDWIFISLAPWHCQQFIQICFQQPAFIRHWRHRPHSFPFRQSLIFCLGWHIRLHNFFTNISGIDFAIIFAHFFLYCAHFFLQDCFAASAFHLLMNAFINSLFDFDRFDHQFYFFQQDCQLIIPTMCAQHFDSDISI